MEKSTKIIIDSNRILVIKKLQKQFDDLVDEQKHAISQNDATGGDGRLIKAITIRTAFNKLFAPYITIGELYTHVEGPYKREALMAFLNMNFIRNRQSNFGQYGLGRIIVDCSQYEDSVKEISLKCSKEESEIYVE